MNKIIKSKLFWVFFSILLIIPASVQAFTIRTNNIVYIASGEVIEGNLYSSGQSLTMEGTVNGDIFCLGQNINIKGTVNGDVICLGQNINLQGEINGNIRLAGETISIESKISRNAMVLGAIVNLGKTNEIMGEMLILASNGDIDGEIKKDFYGGGNIFNIFGKIGGDINLRLSGENKKASFLKINERADIAGNLFYAANNEAEIANRASIKGQVEKRSPVLGTKRGGTTLFFFKFYTLMSSILVALVLLSLWKKTFLEISEPMRKKPLVALGWGIVVFFLTPIIVLFFIFTIIGIPLALLLSALWLIAFFLSSIMAGIALGKYLLEKISFTKQWSVMIAMIFGLFLILLLSEIPFFGGVFSFLFILWGLGGFWLHIRKNISSK